MKNSSDKNTACCFSEAGQKKGCEESPSASAGPAVGTCSLASRPKKLVYIVGMAAALAGLMFGVDVGSITGALSFIKTEFNLSPAQEGLVVSSVLIGAVLGTLGSGWLSRRFGRRFSILISGFIFAVGGIFSALSVSAQMLICSRLFLGVGIGIASFAAPLYLSEVAPKNVRGALISFYQFMITVGILLAFITGTLLTPSGSWRWMLGITFFPALVMFLAVLALPKSPRWLVLTGQKQAAIDVLKRVRHPHEVDPEMAEITESVKHAPSYWQAFKMKGFVKLLCLGVLLQAFQQFSGINAVLYYAPSILKLAGYATPVAQMWGTVLIGTVNCLTTVVAILTVDRLGRRPVLFLGTTLIVISLMVLGFCFLEGMQGAYQVLAVSAILVFIFGFAVSLGPIVWILCSEIFPLQGREIGITISTLSNWICNSFIGALFPVVSAKLGLTLTFWGFSGIGVFALWFFVNFVPETKGVSLEKIEENLLSGKKLRALGSC